MSDVGAGENLVDQLASVNKVFLPAKPVSDQELLAGRTDQLFSLMEVTVTPGAHAAIYGERGVGKTSVAAVFEVISRGRKNLTARINCSVNEDFGRIWTNMADHILDAVAGSAEHSIEDAREAMRAFDYSQVPADVIRYLKKLAGDSEVPIVLIFDEFDIVGDAEVSEQFANLMKSISDLELPVHVVVVGVAEDIDSLLEGHASVARGLHQIKMPRLTEDELRNIVDQGARRLNMTFDRQVTGFIVTMSQGLPHYTHLLAQQSARQAILSRRRHVVEDDLKLAIGSALKLMQQQIVDIYHNATASAKQTMFSDLILACALATKDMQGFFRPTDVTVPLCQVSGKSYTIQGFIKNLSALTTADRGPVLETRVFADKRARYRFANPLLQPYVLIKAAEAGKKLPNLP